MKDYYKILQVSNDASAEVIKASYKALASKWHPDKNDLPDAKANFQDIHQAFEVLSNIEKRKEYDIIFNKTGGRDLPEPNSVVFKNDGSSSFITLEEHLARGGKELYDCDLRNMYFAGIDLSGANFSGANLTNSNFSMCEFRGTNFTNAVLDKTDLSHCDFTQAIFHKTKARKAKIEFSVFYGAIIVETDFSESIMDGCEFCGIGDLKKPDFGLDGRQKWVKIKGDELTRLRQDGKGIATKDTVKPATIKKTNFTKCSLRASWFAAKEPETYSEWVSPSALEIGVMALLSLTPEHSVIEYKRGFINVSSTSSVDVKDRMESCDFTGADLTDAKFFSPFHSPVNVKTSFQDGVYLINCSFKSSNLFGANFSKCKLVKCDFTNAHIVNTDFSDIRHDKKTVFPVGFSIPKSAVLDNCFIATAIYGSNDAYEVILLRHFRDNVLANTSIGLKLISAYYNNAEAWADKIEPKPIVKFLLKMFLSSFVLLYSKINKLAW